MTSLPTIDTDDNRRMPTKPNSLRSIARKFRVSHEFIRKLKAEGIDIADATAVGERLAQNGQERSSLSLALTLPDSNNKTGLRAAIERLRAAELASHQDYLNAIKNEPGQAARYLKAWTTILEQLRKIEVENPSIEKENSQTITKEELAIELGECFRNLRTDLDSLPRRISMHSGKSRTQLEALVEEEINRIVDSLFDCKFC